MSDEATLSYPVCSATFKCRVCDQYLTIPGDGFYVPEKWRYYWLVSHNSSELKWATSTPFIVCRDCRTKAGDLGIFRRLFEKRVKAIK